LEIASAVARSISHSEFGLELGDARLEPPAGRGAGCHFPTPHSASRAAS